MHHYPHLVVRNPYRESRNVEIYCILLFCRSKAVTLHTCFYNAAVDKSLFKNNFQ